MTEQEDGSSWFHGSQQPLTTLQVGSSITHDRDVARIFSHRPSLVSFAGPRGLKHNGTTAGYLYRVAEPVATADVEPHPHPVNCDRWEWLTRRELVVELLEATQVRAAEQLTEDEIAAIRELQRTMGTETLTGAGGMGKTRLALAVAADLVDAFRNGVVFVALEFIADPALVPSTIARALDVSEQDRRQILDRLGDVLRERELLLLLDNFEQVLAAAPVVATLLAAAPRLKVLVTSRAPLHVTGEQEYPVHPLSVPDLDRLPVLETLSQCPAVNLFVKRVQAIQPAFRLNEANARSVAELCLRLDGLPLA